MSFWGHTIVSPHCPPAPPHPPRRLHGPHTPVRGGRGGATDPSQGPEDGGECGRLCALTPAQAVCPAGPRPRGQVGKAASFPVDASVGRGGSGHENGHASVPGVREVTASEKEALRLKKERRCPAPSHPPVPGLPGTSSEGGAQQPQEPGETNPPTHLGLSPSPQCLPFAPTALSCLTAPPALPPSTLLLSPPGL